MCIYVNQIFIMLDTIKNNYQCKSISILHDISYFNENKSFNHWRKITLKNSDLILSPSQYIKEYYNFIDNVTVMSHPDMYQYQIKMKKIDDQHKMKILIMGYNKGKNEIENFICNKYDTVHLGEINIENKYLQCMGCYEDSEVINIIKNINPDFIWFPSVKPESYCYALSYAMLSGYPIIASNIGSNIERLYNRPCSFLINEPLSSVINDIIDQFKNETHIVKENFINKESYFNFLSKYAK